MNVDILKSNPGWCLYVVFASRYNDSNVGSVDFVQTEEFGKPDRKKTPTVDDEAEE